MPNTNRKKREWWKREGKEMRMGEREDDSAWGNKHHLPSGCLTARSRQVERGGGCVPLYVCIIFPARRRASVHHLLSKYGMWQLPASAWVSCSCYTWLVSQWRSVGPLCICPSVGSPHAICLCPYVCKAAVCTCLSMWFSCHTHIHRILGCKDHPHYTTN